MGKVEIRINLDTGEMTMEGHGFKGTDCQNARQRLLNALSRHGSDATITSQRRKVLEGEGGESHVGLGL